MTLFSPFNINEAQSIAQMRKTNESNAIDLSDPDSMYDVYIAPNLDIFEGMTKNEWKRELMAMTQIELNLKKKQKKIPTHHLLREISIQVSLYEALIFRDMLKSNPQQSWVLSKKKAAFDQFQFQSKNDIITITIKENNVILHNNNTPIGTLKMDMELALLEKLHGTLFNQPFILDPIWLKKQKKVDAVNIQIDTLKTEIVHNKTHKDTLWTGKGSISRMTISKNESLSINKQLLLNFKRIHWKSWTLTTFQWLTPWYRLPIQGRYKLSAI